MQRKLMVSQILRDGVQRNLGSVAAFVDNAAHQAPSFSPNCLRGKAFSAFGSLREPSLRPATGEEPVLGLVHVGGEMCNSWTTNYELHTFVSGLMLAAVATALADRFEEYSAITNTSVRRERIMADISSLDEATMISAFRNPRFGILSQFVDDVEGDRYAKAHLWGMLPESQRRFVFNIPMADLDRTNHHVPTPLFTEEDIAISREVLRTASGLFEAKALQMYRSIGKFLETLEVDLSSIPFFFTSTPNMHLSTLPSDHEVFGLLLRIMHSRSLYGDLVQDDKPWVVKEPCPNCGIQSKYTVKTRLNAEGSVSKSTCQDRDIVLRNEVGWETGVLRGCGHQWESEVPNSPEALAEYLKARAVGLHFPANMAMILLRSGLPVVGSLFEDPGLIYRAGSLVRPEGYPTGDNPDMIISVMATELAMASGRLGGVDGSRFATALPLMMSQHPQITDPTVMQVKRGQTINVGTTNSSISALLEHGMSELDVFRAVLSVQHYPFSVISGYRRRVDVGAMISEAEHRGIYVAQQ